MMIPTFMTLVLYIFWYISNNFLMRATLFMQVKELCGGKPTCEIHPTFAMFGVGRKFSFSFPSSEIL